MSLKTQQLFEINSRVIRRVTMTIRELHENLTVAKLRINPNPIGQRPPTKFGYQNKKNEGIIESILRGYGIDTIYLRDITFYDVEHPIRVLYGNDGFLTIDGGHRCRAVRWFMENKFHIVIDNKHVYFRDLQAATIMNNPNLVDVYEMFMESTVAVKYIQCSSTQAHEWFLMINNMTKSNEIESIMSDDESKVTEWIRRKTWYVREYNNKKEIHPIFEVYMSDKSEHTTDYWGKNANEGGSFYYKAFITLCKAIGKGNVNAGETAWKKIIAENYGGRNNITAETANIWNKFFSDLKDFKDEMNIKQGLNDEMFGCFSCLWFYLLSEYGINGFKLKMDVFGELLFKARSNFLYNGENGKYSTMLVKNLDGETEAVSTIMKRYVKGFAYGEMQNWAAKRFIKEIEALADDDVGIVYMATERSPPIKKKQVLLHSQKGQCFIAMNSPYCKSVKKKKKLTLDDFHYAHDVPHSKGGKDGAMVCIECHKEQGQLTFAEYMSVLEMREAA